MVRSKLARVRLNALLPLAGLTLWAACSSDKNDFFGAPISSGAGAGGTTGIGTGGSSAGKDGATGGSSGLTGGAGGTTSSGGGATGGGAGTSPTGGAGTGGAGGTAAIGGHSAQGGAPTGGSAGTDVTPSDGGAAGAGAGGESGGQAGDTSSSGAGGSSGVGGVAGNGGSSADAGTGGTSSPTPCANDGACGNGEYCQKASCNASMGTCEPRPASCTGADAAFAPVCGCDHMTYFSVCVAEHEGTNVASSGECTSNEATCTRAAGGSSCSPARDNAHCYRPRTGCNGVSAAQGVCWVLPAPCPTEDKVNYYCNATSGGNGVCMGLCEILTAENAVWRDSNLCN